MEAVRTGQWHKVMKEIKTAVDKNMLTRLYRVRQELTVPLSDDLALHGARIVVPSALQQRLVNIAHEGHQGVVKTKKSHPRKGMVPWHR